jgi:hypothetical protein
MLLTQSLQRGLTDAVLPIPPGQTIAVETVGLTADQAFVTAVIEKWLSHQGLNLPKDGKESLLAKVTLEAFGTLQDQTFFGVPQISGGLIPIAVPELAFYKALRQRSLARFSIDFIDKKTGRLVRSTPVYEGDAFYHQYTYFLLSTIGTQTSCHLRRRMCWANRNSLLPVRVSPAGRNFRYAVLQGPKHA